MTLALPLVAVALIASATPGGAIPVESRAPTAPSTAPSTATATSPLLAAVFAGGGALFGFTGAIATLVAFQISTGEPTFQIAFFGLPMLGAATGAAVWVVGSDGSPWVIGGAGAGAGVGTGIGLLTGLLLAVVAGDELALEGVEGGAFAGYFILIIGGAAGGAVSGGAVGALTTAVLVE